jgi:transcriptional regulator with XRE-family HTH domain
MSERAPVAGDIADETIGANLRRFRQQKGLTLAKLAETQDLTYQQIYKYETGEDRVAASRLLSFAHALEVPVEYFFEGLDGIGAELDPHEIAQIQRVAGLVGRLPEPVRSQTIRILESIDGACRALSGAPA